MSIEKKEGELYEEAQLANSVGKMLEEVMLERARLSEIFERVKGNPDLEKTEDGNVAVALRGLEMALQGVAIIVGINGLQGMSKQNLLNIQSALNGPLAKAREIEDIE